MDVNPGKNVRQPPRFLDRLLFVAYVLADAYFNVRDPHSAASSGRIETALWILAYCVAFVAVVLERKKALPILRAALPLGLLLLLPVVSLLWSDSPAVTARTSLALIGSTTIALALVCRLGLRGFVETIGLLVAAEAALSVVALVFFPNQGFMQDGGEWQGIFTQKNQLGLSMILGIVTVACLWVGSRGIGRASKMVALISFSVILVGARNAGALFLALIFGAIFPLALWCRARQNIRPAFYGIFALAAAIVIGLMVGLRPDDLLALFGKDSSLTGRTDLWDAAVTAIGARPTLGFGYGAFWSDGGPSANFINVDWDPNTAHNGFLEVALNVGFIGDFFLILFLAVGVKRASLFFWRGRDGLTAWPLFAMFYIIWSNLSEANFERSHNIHWMVLVAAFLFATNALPGDVLDAGQKIERVRALIPPRALRPYK